MSDKNLLKTIEAAFLGLSIGDALGVPVAFQSRDNLKEKPVELMMGFGTWNQVPGTFSDDSSLTFCTAEALIEGFDLAHIGQLFASWKNYGLWAAHDFPFDIGVSTLRGIENLEKGALPELAGGDSERDNGNGSLMRILPMTFFCLNMLKKERFEFIKKVSSLTHRHNRSIIACFYYTEFARSLVLGESKIETYKNLQTWLPEFLKEQEIQPVEIEVFYRLFTMDITQYKEKEINSFPYVLDTIEAAIWCLLKSDSYEKTVLTAVNLGGDTDTTASVAGGLAGILYGIKGLPKEWILGLVRQKDIMDLATRFYMSLN